MPQISPREVVIELKEYLPDENALSDAQLDAIASNIIENHIAENDKAKHHAEALYKSLMVAAKRNHLLFTVDGSGIVEEQAGGMSYKYSQDGRKNVWVEFERSLPGIGPYLPHGGYIAPTTIGILIKKGEGIKTTSCEDNSRLIL